MRRTAASSCSREEMAFKSNEEIRCTSDLTSTPLYRLSRHFFVQSTPISFLVRSWVLRKQEWSLRAEHVHPQRQTRTHGLYVSIEFPVMPSDLLYGIANPNNGFRHIPRRVPNRDRVRRRNGDIRIHIYTHQEIPECGSDRPGSLCVLTAVLPVLAGASNRRSGFHAPHPPS